MRKITHVLLLTVFAATGSVFAAEDSGLRGPVMGFVLDTAKQVIRSVNGIAGSSTLGPSLDLPFPVAAAAFSPRGDFAVVVSGSEDRSAYLVRHLNNEPATIPLDGGIKNADGIFFNVDASAGVLLSTEGCQLQLLRGLPGSPTAGLPLDLSSITGEISAIAVNRTATGVLIATSAEHGALYLAEAADADSPLTARLIASFGKPTAIVLTNNEKDVIVADAAVNQIVGIRNFSDGPESFLLASERDGISAPAGLLLSEDSRKLYIANSARRTLDVWNFETRSIESSLFLDADPTRLVPFQGLSTFVLNQVGEHPLLLFDVSDNPAVYFVPAGRDR